MNVGIEKPVDKVPATKVDSEILDASRVSYRSLRLENVAQQLGWPATSTVKRWRGRWKGKYTRPIANHVDGKHLPTIDAATRAARLGA